MYRKMLGIIASALAATAASADTGTTMHADVVPIFTAGTLTGCAINFDEVRKDTEYQKGDLVYISGSLSFWVFPGKEPAFGLKLGVRPLSSPSAQYVKPAEGYLLNGFSSNADERLSTLQSESRGFGLFTFKVGDEGMKAVQKIAETGELQVGYAMRPGGMAAPLTVDLRMKRFDLDNPSKSEIAPKAPSEWLSCMEAALTESLKPAR